MDIKEEYHDPDYPEISSTRIEKTVVTDEEKLQRIKNIVQREFSKELVYKETELNKIDQHMLSARRLLHRLRYALVNRYYGNQKLQLTLGQIHDDISAQTPRTKGEVSTLLRTEQRRVHPSLRKLLGKKTVDLDEIFKFRSPRNNVRKDYMAMSRAKNYTIPAEKNLKSLRPDNISEMEQSVSKRSSIEGPSSSKPKKIPRHIEPAMNKEVVKLDEIARNQQKHRYRIIIGNTSKYAPPASAADRSTHKWLLYIRGPPNCPDISEVVSGVVVRLHETYAPHHLVTLDKPPYHISRRGWGEFPAKIELQFACPLRNRPATVEHTIKLDRNYTGLQTLGAETIVDVWLYSTEEMLKFEFKEETAIEPENQNDATDPIEKDQQNGRQPNTESWMDFFTTESTELDVDEMIIKPIKKGAQEQNDIENLIESNVISKELEIKMEDDLNIVEHGLEDDLRPTVNHSPKYKTRVIDNNYDIKVEFEPETESVHLRESDDVDYQVSVKKEIIPSDSDETTPPTKKRIVKYLNPTTGKIYYLEMDINLDINKVQEIVINSTSGNQTITSTAKPPPNGVKSNIKKLPKKGGVSLLKPEIQNLLKNEINANVKNEKQKSIPKPNMNNSHILNDHCYLGVAWAKTINIDMSKAELPLQNNFIPSRLSVATIEKQKTLKPEPTLYESVCNAAKRLKCVRVAVNYLLSKIPLVSEYARNPDFVKHFPFAVENDQKYWKLDFLKRRHMEWSRAKLINKILTENMKDSQTIWRTKQILIFGRLHGYHPVRTDVMTLEEEWSSWQDTGNRNLENIKEVYPDPTDLSTLSVFQDDGTEVQYCGAEPSNAVDLTECSDEEIDVTNVDRLLDIKTRERIESGKNLAVLPVQSDEDRLRYVYIERKCAELGVDLRNEDVGSGYCYSAVHAVMLSAMRRFAEELLRGALATARSDTPQTPPPSPPPLVWTQEWSTPTSVRLQHIREAVRRGRLDVLSGSGLGTTCRDPYAL